MQSLKSTVKAAKHFSSLPQSYAVVYQRWWRQAGALGSAMAALLMVLPWHCGEHH